MPTVGAVVAVRTAVQGPARADSKLPADGRVAALAPAHRSASAIAEGHTSADTSDASTAAPRMDGSGFSALIQTSMNLIPHCSNVAIDKPPWADSSKSFNFDSRSNEYHYDSRHLRYTTASSSITTFDDNIQRIWAITSHSGVFNFLFPSVHLQNTSTHPPNQHGNRRYSVKEHSSKSYFFLMWISRFILFLQNSEISSREARGRSIKHVFGGLMFSFHDSIWMTHLCSHHHIGNILICG
jgi:hypothetical protein